MVDGECVVNYGYNLAKEVAELVANQVEPYGVGQINEKEREIERQLALIDIVSNLKAALVRAANTGDDVIDINADTELRAAYERFVEAFPDAEGILPEDGLVHAKAISDIQRLLEGQVRGPVTIIEYTMIEVGRRINDQQAMNDSAREILKDYADAVRNWIRNAAVR